MPSDFLDRRQRVEAVQLEEIDVVGAEPPQAVVDGAHEMEPRRADVVRPGAMAEGGLGRDEHPAAAAGDRLAENLLRLAVRVHVRAIEHGQPGVEADVDEPRGLRGAGRAPVLEELVAAAEGAGTERQSGHEEA